MSDQLLDTRMSVAETHIEFIEKELSSNAQEHIAMMDVINRVKGTINTVEVHLSKQNGILPRLETMVTQQYEDQQEIKACISGIHTKNKIIWAILSALAAAGLTLLIKMLVA